MSSGPAITMSENVSVKSSPMIFGGPKNEGLVEVDDISSPLAFEVESPSSTSLLNHVPKPAAEKPVMNPGDSGDSRANNVLQPAKNENMKVNLLKKPGKVEPTSNCLIENKSPIPMTIGASGDAPPRNEKIKLLTNKNNAPILNHQEPNVAKDSQLAKNDLPKLSNKANAQTYAKVAQNSPTNSKNVNNKTESISLLRKPVSNAPMSVNVQGEVPVPMMNGFLEDASMPSKMKDADSTSSEPAADVKSPTQANTSSSKSQSRMKLLVRSKAVCHDDPSINPDSSYPWEPPLSSSSASISDSIFPSPFPISREEALKETSGHISRTLDDPANARSANDAHSNEQDFQTLSNPERAIEDGNFDVQPQESFATNTDGDFPSSSKLNSGPLRREAEKPPRMQKQKSQDRLLLRQQKPSFDAESKSETLSRESSVECVDSTGVDVHEFLITTLRNSTRDRAILLKIEHDMIAFVNNKTSDFMKFPPMTSYHRMLVHRVAAYFGMDHNVDETGRSVIINKTTTTKLPEVRFADQFDPRQTDQHSGRRDDDMRRRSILKRTNQSRSFDRDDIKGGNWKDRQRSIEEREEQYEKVRARIFNKPEANMNSPPMYGRRAMSSLAAARMACWSDRPWNSTDVDPSMRMPGPRLTTRANSYSSISVLPRHNSATSLKTGSSSSVSSMNGVNNNMQNFARQSHNMGPRPPTPGRGRNGMGDNNNGAYYYMQHQNQDVPFDAVEDDIARAQSWFPESPEALTPCSSEVIVPTDAPILLAVPYGTTLPPETVLCHPITGMPYLSPEGYQLVYQSGAPGSAGSGGMASPQFARYYQIPPPQPSPQQHPGIAYSQGYNPYEETQHKAQGSNSSDYAITQMSSYPYNMSTTTTVYSGVQGQPNISYAYQPAIYRPTSEPPMAVTPSQTGILPGTQGRHTPVMQHGGQNYVQQTSIPTAPNYPPYVITQQPPGPLQPGGIKDGQQPQNLTGATTPKNIMAQPVPGMQHVPHAYPGQLPMQTVFSPPAGVNPTVLPSNTTEGYSQGVQNEPPKSSNQVQAVKKTTEDELNEKMQAIVLKNLQQQQGQQLPVSSASESTNTVTTSLSPSTIPIQKSKPVPEVANQNRNMANPVQHRHPTEHQGYMQPQYQYTNGMPQAQPMQVYLMPTNSPGAGASYRTYSQFMTQPQTPHVMGPGMHFVYLSPPMGGVMGMEGGNAMNTPPPNGPVYHHHHHTNPIQQHQHHHHQHHPPVRQASEPAFTSNTNNNNNNAVRHVAQPTNVRKTQDTKPKVDNDAAQKSKSLGEENTETVAKLDDESEGVVQNGVTDEEAFTDGSASSNDVNTEQESEKIAPASNPSSSAGNEQQITKNQSVMTTPIVSTTKPRSSSNPAPPVNSTSQSYHVHNHPVIHHQHPNTSVLLSNMPPQDYRIAGMNMASGSPVSYPAGVVSPYSVYPNIGPTPYVYLPTAAAGRSPKLQDMKMYPQAVAAASTPSHSSGLIAVQLPNQNQIQFAASLQHQNQIYYTPHNYTAQADYTSQAQVPAQPSSHLSAKSEVASQPHGRNLQVNAEAVTAENITPQQLKGTEKSNQVSDKSTEEAKSTDTANETEHRTVSAEQ